MGKSFFKAQSSKLKRLFSLKRGKTGVQIFELCKFVLF
jgi:hypothetical protein